MPEGSTRPARSGPAVGTPRLLPHDENDRLRGFLHGSGGLELLQASLHLVHELSGSLPQPLDLLATLFSEIDDDRTVCTGNGSCHGWIDSAGNGLHSARFSYPSGHGCLPAQRIIAGRQSLAKTFLAASPVCRKRETMG